MVKCRRCLVEEASVWIPYAKLHLCKKCFSEFTVKRVRETVEKYRMFGSTDKVAVAVSGGKDSAVLLYTLKRAFPDVRFTCLLYTSPSPRDRG